VGDTAQLAARLDAKRIEAVAGANGAMLAASGDPAIAQARSVNDAFARAPAELSVDHLSRAQAPGGDPLNVASAPAADGALRVLTAAPASAGEGMSAREQIL